MEQVVPALYPMPIPGPSLVVPSVALPLETFIVCASPIYGHAIQQLLECGPIVCHTRVIFNAERIDPAPCLDSDVVLVAPQNWEELEAWLPRLLRCRSSPPWLLLADLRVSGAFLCQLLKQACILVPPGSSLEELETALRAAAAGRISRVEAQLLARFPHRAAAGLHGRPGRPPTVMELQCGCAVSLGLSNRRIGGLLHISETTVKSHVHSLLCKLELRNRTELGIYVHRALTPPPPSGGWRTQGHNVNPPVTPHVSVGMR